MPTDPRPRRLLMPEDLRRPFRYATRRNPALRTRGGKIAVIAHRLNRPLLPHQQYIADVGTELNPPGSRLRFRYQRVVLAEPRQVGKTTLLRPVLLDRCLETPATSAFMTAQDGKTGAERWDDLVTDIEPSLFGPYAKVKRGKGDQECTWPNGSKIAPFVPNRDGLHGESPDVVGIDEGWAFSAEAGADVMRAVRPAQITRVARQLWIMSAAGTAESEWWEALVEAGRKSVDDPRSTTAFFEHSMAPGDDPYDPASWEFHPGLDGLITIPDLAEEAKPENNSHADFLRGFMNTSTKVRDKTVIPISEWDALTQPGMTPPPTRSIGYDVAIDLSAASVWQAWRDPETRGIRLAVLRTDERADWLPDYLAQVQDDTGITPSANDAGPARVVTELLTRAGRTVQTIPGRDAGTAWSAFKSAVRDESLRHDGSPAMRAAIEVAAELIVGDLRTLSARHSLGPIDPLRAANAAAWFVDDAATPAIQMWT